MLYQKSQRVTLRFPEPIYTRLENYAEEIGISKSEALRTLVEDGLNKPLLRSRNQQSFERLIEIAEYVFASTIASNKHFLPDKTCEQIIEDTRKALHQKHPLIADEN